MTFDRVGYGFAVACAAVSISCSGGATSTNAPGGNTLTAGIDGAWDITAAGGGIAPSEMTIASGVVTGVIVANTEGKTKGACKTLKDRFEIKLTIEGNTLHGTATRNHEVEGSELDCPAHKRVFSFAGSRAGGSAGSGLSGEWEVHGEDVQPGVEDESIIVVVDGLAAKAWGKNAKASGKEAGLNVSVVGGSAAGTWEGPSFAARRR